MKKQFKKILSHLLPKGAFKEKIKQAYYNSISGNKVSFGLVSGNRLLYKTSYDGIEFTTTDPLYNIVPDFDYYQHFYKVKRGDVVIDAGANDGYLALLFSKLVGDDGKIYAFEPDSINVGHIRDNIKLNRGAEKNIAIEDLLLWNENTEVDFYEAGTVGSSAVWIPEGGQTVKKRTVTIDSWAETQELNRLDFIKMDIEGAEIEAIEGSAEVIKKLKPNFAIASYHVVNGEQTYIKLEKMFEKMDYPFKTVRFKETEIITFAGQGII